MIFVANTGYDNDLLDQHDFLECYDNDLLDQDGSLLIECYDNDLLDQGGSFLNVTAMIFLTNTGSTIIFLTNTIAS